MSNYQRKYGKKKVSKKMVPMAKNPKDYNQDMQIKNIKKRLRTVESETELKHKDTEWTVAAISATAGNFQLLNGLSQGNTQLTRIGSQINMTSVQFKGRIASSTAQTYPQIVRLVVFADAQPNAAAPVITDILDSGGLTALFLMFAPYNHNNANRFKIFYDKVFVLNPSAATNFPQTQYVKKVIPMSRITQYNAGNAGTVADINRNSLYAFVLSNDGTNNPTALITFRTYFKDA